MNKQMVGITKAMPVPHRRYCECGRELAALAQEFGPNLSGHLVKCEACEGYGHHSGNHTVCMHCGRYQHEATCH